MSAASSEIYEVVVSAQGLNLPSNNLAAVEPNSETQLSRVRAECGFQNLEQLIRCLHAIVRKTSHDNRMLFAPLKVFRNKHG